MKTFKLNSQILIICCALTGSGASTMETHIGGDNRKYLIEYNYKTKLSLQEFLLKIKFQFSIYGLKLGIHVLVEIDSFCQ